jgi:hypothetical protein
MVYFSTSESFPPCNYAIMNGNHISFDKISHARVLELSYHELSFSFIFSNNLLLEPKIGMVQLISFLHELYTYLTMIQSHVGSMFQTLFDL